MKYIVMSDCHRGDGSAGDEFANNSLVYKCALEYYLKEGFTYIELGDAEELWENDAFEQIYITHTSVYDLLRRFHDPDPAKTRYLKVWGNHDEDWRDNPAPLRTLFPNIQLHEAIILQVNGGQVLKFSVFGKTGATPFLPEGKTGFVTAFPGNGTEADFSILLLHGHQADPSCLGYSAKISRYLVRHVWAGFQRFGIGDPTRAAENSGRCNEIDDTLYHLAKGKMRENGELSRFFPADGNLIIIAGHTHRPVFANLSLTERRFLETGIGTRGVRRKEKADPVYYNAGSCIHPRCITGIEITAAPPPPKDDGPIRPHIALVRWGYTAAEGTSDPPYPLSITRSVLEEGKTLWFDRLTSKT